MPRALILSEWRRERGGEGGGRGGEREGGGREEGGREGGKNLEVGERERERRKVLIHL